METVVFISVEGWVSGINDDVLHIYVSLVFVVAYYCFYTCRSCCNKLSYLVLICFLYCAMITCPTSSQVLSVEDVEKIMDETTESIEYQKAS